MAISALWTMENFPPFSYLSLFLKFLSADNIWHEVRKKIFFKGRKKKRSAQRQPWKPVFPSVTRSQSEESEKDTKVKRGGQGKKN